MIDPLFRVEVAEKMPNPQRVIYTAMHQDYSEEFVFDELHTDKQVWKNTPDKSWQPTGRFVTEWDGPTEEECGDRIVKNLLNGGRGHYGPLEHPQIVLNCGWFPHSTMQQIRTHRVGVSFDVQSFRYTGQRIVDAVENYHRLCTDSADGDYYVLDRAFSPVFYLRPLGFYTDRKGNKYEYTFDHRYEDLCDCKNACDRYAKRIAQGFSEEHARGLIPFDVRQHWVMSANARSLMHLLDLRAARNAQLECQWLCQLIWPHFEAWCPSVAAWYKANRWERARLSP